MTELIRLRKKKIPYEDISVPVSRLAFYPENPRIYSRFAATSERTQDKIQQLLEKMDHVRDLRTQIDRDGQINEPLYCIQVDPASNLHDTYDYQVLEGNSRLAAIRMTRRGSLPQSSVPCRILDFSAYDETTTEGLIFSLLGGFHITGKTDWESYENAAYIYRRYKNHGVALEEVAKEIGKSNAKVKRMIEAFELMIGAGDEQTSHWSYYEAYVSSTKIRNHRKSIAELDDRVVSLIKDGNFPRALDMRDKLPAILGNRRAKKVFLDVSETDPFGEALQIAEISGDTNTTLKRLVRYRKDLGTDQTKRSIRQLLRNEKTRGQTQYELKHISKFVESLLQRTS